MNCTAIISEYNPFHNGHQYQIDKAKKMFPDNAIMAIMSGNFVQRGDVAVLDKRDRARQAIECGVDIVVELPCVWSMSSATRFATGAVYLAKQSGVVDNLLFSVETDDIDALKLIASICIDTVYSRQIKTYLDQNLCSYGEAVTRTVNSVLGKDYSDILTKPNNLLGIEYIKALKSFKSTITPVCLKRIGCEHNSQGSGLITSAADIRRKIARNEDVSPFMPKASFDILCESIDNMKAPADIKKLEVSILADLRRKKAKDFANIPDVSEGIENRILSMARQAVTLDELYSLVKTKRYTHARIRRIILSSYLGISVSDVSSLPPYIRVLGFNDKGREVLRQINSFYSYPCITKYADLKHTNENAKKIFDIESRITDIYNLTLPKRRECGTDITDPIYIVK